MALRMSSHGRYVIAGLGALTPIAANLLVVDFQNIFIQSSTAVVLGYAVRVVVLFLAGMLMAFLYADENQRLKLFQLGVAAPAFILSLQNGKEVKLPEINTASLLVRQVFAQEKEEAAPRTFTVPKPEGFEGFYQGLTGGTPKSVWFVIVGSHLKVQDAQAQAARINARKLSFKAEVFAPYAGNKYYAVVIGQQLRYKEALELQKQARNGGLSNDTYLWTFPK